MSIAPRRLSARRRLLQHALAYAEIGFRVLPLYTVRNGVCTCRLTKGCQSPGKHPCISNWVIEATTDHRTIEDWWRRLPDSNVGIATGRESGIFVLDIDPRHGGPKSLVALIERFGPLPPTVEAETGGGGRHLVYSYPGGHVGSPSGVEPGIDIRGDGGLIVAAPSMHFSGRRYAWRPGCDPFANKPADLREKWLEWPLSLQSPTLCSCNRANRREQSKQKQPSLSVPCSDDSFSPPRT